MKIITFPFGFTLIELLTVIAILSILGAFTPKLFPLLQSSKNDAALRKLYQLSQYTRQKAITRGKTIILCGSHNSQTCSKDWNQANVLIFEDTNKNYQLDNNETLFIKENFKGQKISWRGSNRAYMRYHPEGYLLEWGSYTICPNDEDLWVEKLILNRSGRAYKKKIPINEHKKTSACKQSL